ncbi:MAG: LysM peptidoglycan-binding domain-containing protein [Bacteroides sp.]|nr:LysM peptidoglycan-binding domain-containing protein [Bacteroides sp.]MCM1457408.1 LysM peptidoglycan-binding domain-containing protein [Lachnoclostridium sp.]
MKSLISCFFIISAAVMPSVAGAQISAKDTITDNNIVMPEAYEKATEKMLEDWYLYRYTSLDSVARLKTGRVATDAEYTRRLSELATEIEMPFNSVVKRHIESYVVNKPRLVERMLGLNIYYEPIFINALGKYGLPMELKYLPIIESALDPKAVSRAGAAGLWQFMPGTAVDEGLEVGSLVDERFDPYKSSEAAAKYLKKLYNIHGDWALALASYNWGSGNLTKARNRANKTQDFWEVYPFLPAETRAYVPAFIAINYAMRYFPEHGISPVLGRRPMLTDTVHVSKRVHMQQISDVLGIPMAELRGLNPHFKTDIIPGNATKQYTLVLPSRQAWCYSVNEDSILNHDAAKYALRGVVNPSDGVTSTGSDSRGDYRETTTVKYHKVGRHETLASIAKKYGVTASSIRQANNMRSSKVKRGQRLRINIVKREYIRPDTVASSVSSTPAPAPVQTPALSADTTATDTASTNVKAAFENSRPATKAVSNPPAKKNTATTDKPKNVKYRVKAGDNLLKIAKAHGTTVDAIKAANNLKGDNIRVGQSLNIPQKTASKKKSTRRRK